MTAMDYGWHDVVGIVGVVITLGAYLGLQLGRLDPRAPTYSVLNAIGAGLVTVSLVFEFNLSAFIIEAVWVLISLYGVAVSLRRS